VSAVVILARQAQTKLESVQDELHQQEDACGLLASDVQEAKRQVKEAEGQLTQAQQGLADIEAEAKAAEAHLSHLKQCCNKAQWEVERVEHLLAQYPNNKSYLLDQSMTSDVVLDTDNTFDTSDSDSNVMLVDELHLPPHACPPSWRAFPSSADTRPSRQPLMWCRASTSTLKPLQARGLKASAGTFGRKNTSSFLPAITTCGSGSPRTRGTRRAGVRTWLCSWPYTLPAARPCM
jgi:hypothetical protein